MAGTFPVDKTRGILERYSYNIVPWNCCSKPARYAVILFLKRITLLRQEGVIA